MSNLALRILSAAVLIPLVLLLLFFGPPWLFSTVIALLAALMGFEYASISMKESSRAHLALVAFLSAICAVSVAYYKTFPWAPLAVLALIPIISLAAFMFGRADFKYLVQGAVHTAAGSIYSGVLMGFIALLLVFHANGREWVLTLWAGAVIGDTFAYAAGRLMGRRKLARRLSPGKTWAGAFGGLAGTSVAIVLSKLFFLTELSWVEVSLLSVPLSVSFQVGDLAESFLKRGFGVKDSSNLIPGHGGLLDRTDSLIFGAPVVFFFSILR